MIYSLILPPLEISSLTQPLKALKEIVSYRNSFSIQQIKPKLYTNLNKPDSFLRDLTYRSLIPYRIRKCQRQRSLSCDLFYWSKKRKKSISSVFFRNHPKHVHLLIIQSNRNCNFLVLCSYPFSVILFFSSFVTSFMLPKQVTVKYFLWLNLFKRHLRTEDRTPP